MPAVPMLPVSPELVAADAVTCDDAFAVIGFGVHACSVSIPIRQLGPSPLAEVWRSGAPLTRERHGDISFACNGHVLLGVVAAAAGPTETITSEVYAKIVATCRDAGYPHLLRVWNHVGGINAPERDLERYRRFCTGRHDALTRSGFANRQFPAACAVGMAGEGVIVYFLASREAGIQVENPRQVAAYEYPREYGPRSPSFARATVAQWNGNAMVFIAGTSSVVGHRTLHAGDVTAQLDETLRNIDLIVNEAASRAGRRGSLGNLAVAKTYLRRASDYDKVAPRVTAALPHTQHLFLEADICRADLLIEIEGVATL